MAETRARNGTQIPDPTLLRMCRYLRILERTDDEKISSAEIAEAAGVNAAQVRKDLSFFGEFGQPGVGYRTKDLLDSLKRMMGLDEELEVVVVGAGALGSALINYPGFENRGFRIVAVFDNNPAKVGHRLRGYEIIAFDRLPEVIADHDVSLAIIAVPRVAAQEVVSALIEAGVKGILNFAPINLKVPDDVVVRSVDLTLQLETLAYYLRD
ncbi:MAG TPA: redox-sensing transcriptional repressor Rex [Armatimonadetes bacterium]|nr:redox-sensing transcriptional repressor Rex [Armatimonadota bacterium]